MNSKHELYPTFNAMHARCENTRNAHYKNYGGRGIKVCERWARTSKGFENFILDLGPKPSPKHSIDRINVNGDYSPENTRWATAKERANNKRPNTKQAWTAEGYMAKCFLPVLLYS